MGDALYKEWAKRLLIEWEDSLISLRPKYEEAVYAALVAFLGIQSGLWQLYIAELKAAGIQPEEHNLSIRFSDEKLHNLPWFCLFNPINPEAAWFLVRGKGLADSAEVMPELLRNDICSSLITLSEKEQTSFFGHSEEVFSRWNIFDARIKLYEAYGLEEVRSGGQSKPRIPTADCSMLMDDWHIWWEGLQKTRGALQAFVLEINAVGKSGNDLKLHFLKLAGEIWQLMQENGVMHCAPFGDGKRSFLDAFKRKNPIVFNGFLVLFGDHQKLWQEINAQKRQA